MYLLENPDRLPEQKGLSRFHVELRLWHYPSFEPYVAWLLYRHRTEKSCLLREVVWDKPDEANRMLNPLEGIKRGFIIKPRFRIRDVEIDKEEIDHRLGELQRIEMPVFIENSAFGLDGESSGIARGNGFLDTRISWWCEGPPEWKTVTSWFYHTKTYLETQLEKAPPRG